MEENVARGSERRDRDSWDRSCPPAAYCVLLVEDNPIYCDLLLSLLEECGCAVHTASDMETLAELKDRRFDLVFLDSQLSEQNELELTSAVQALLAANGEATIISTSADFSSPATGLLGRAFFDGACTKPLTQPEVARLLRWSHGRNHLTPLSAEEPIDADAALQLTGGDPELVGMLADAFCEHRTRLLHTLSEALAQHSRSSVEFAAHAIRGSASVLAAFPLREAAGLLEKAAQEPWPYLEEVAAQVKYEMQRLHTALRPSPPLP